MRQLRVLASWPALSVLALLTYNTWAFWAPMNGRPEIFNGYLSELSASDQPNNLFFRCGDLLTSLIVGALGIRAILTWHRQSPHRPRWWVVSAGALLLFAVATFFDSFFAMDCSPTLSAACKVLEQTGRLSAVHYAHTFTSVAAQTGIVTSMIATYIAMRRARAGGLTWQRLLLAGCVSEVVALGAMLILLAADLPGIGYPQAGMVALGSLWFAAVGFGLVGEDAGVDKGEEAKEEEYAS